MPKSVPQSNVQFQDRWLNRSNGSVIRRVGSFELVVLKDLSFRVLNTKTKKLIGGGKGKSLPDAKAQASKLAGA